MGRRADLDRFYVLLHELAQRTGGTRYLADEASKVGLPQRGVYFFFEPGEVREDGRTPRVVRVGTHALRNTSKATLWGRLRQHRGHMSGPHTGGGNHRGSIFRQHVGTALLNRGITGVAASAIDWTTRDRPKDEALRADERQVEFLVSEYIRAMPFLWVEVGDPPGELSDRARIEANAIGLLSNLDRPPIDPPSSGWLGHRAGAPKVPGSGLWNVDHTDKGYDPGFLGLLAQYIRQ